MKPLPLSADLIAVAPRVVWFEAPEAALADPVRFLAYVMTYGTPEDLAVVRRHVGDGGFREALEHAPAGHHGCALLGLLARHGRQGRHSAHAHAEVPGGVIGLRLVLMGRPAYAVPAA